MSTVKSYFTKRQAHTEESNNIIVEVERFLIDIYNREFDAGFNIRELTNLVVHAATTAEAGTMLMKAVESRKRLTRD